MGAACIDAIARGWAELALTRMASLRIVTTSTQLRSLVTSSGKLELSLTDVELAEPAQDEVLVRMEAAPINYSDMVILFGAADLHTAKQGGTAARPTLSADIPEHEMSAMRSRLDQSLPVGLVGAGVVEKAGVSAAAQALLGRVVAIRGGGMYATYRCVSAAECVVLPDDVTAAQGAAFHANPMTALAMTEVMRLEGHPALVHTAAASNVGQILNRICVQDGIGLVNVVRTSAQEALLRRSGATQVVNSSAVTFMDDLIEALAMTGATLAFDAIGGGPLAGQILLAMEAAASRDKGKVSIYGFTTTPTQLYVYGRLDARPIVLPPGIGGAWCVGGWSLTPFLKKVGPEVGRRLVERVRAELTTTFASEYAEEISLAEALQLRFIDAYSQRATGRKFLINPGKSLSLE